ncbi:MAG: 2-dehydropantoate 2-reductase [Propionicimonas sp.]
MKLLFLGAGAIGTYVGGSLAAAGHRVGFTEQQRTAEVIATEGLRLTRGGRTEAVRDVAIYTSAAEALAAEAYDAVVVALKSFDTEAAVRGLVETGAELPAVLSLQNGVANEPLIADLLGADRVITGTVTTAVSKPGVGQVVEEKLRGIGIAMNHPVAEQLVDALNSAGLQAQRFPEPRAMKWSKLLTNLTGNATSAILNEPVSNLFADPISYNIEIQVLRECLAVMAGLGLAPVDLPGTPVRALALAAKRLPRFIAQPALTKALGSGRGDKMPSFHIDLYSGRGRTEVSFLNGAVAHYGSQVGVATPANQGLTEILESLSSGELPLETYQHNPSALTQALFV